MREGGKSPAGFEGTGQSNWLSKLPKNSLVLLSKNYSLVFHSFTLAQLWEVSRAGQNCFTKEQKSRSRGLPKASLWLRGEVKPELMSRGFFYTTACPWVCEDPIVKLVQPLGNSALPVPSSNVRPVLSEYRNLIVLMAGNRVNSDLTTFSVNPANAQKRKGKAHPLTKLGRLNFPKL